MKPVENMSGKQRFEAAKPGTENRRTHDHLNDASFRGPQDAVLLDVKPRTLDPKPKVNDPGGPISLFRFPVSGSLWNFVPWAQRIEFSAVEF